MLWPVTKVTNIIKIVWDVTFAKELVCDFLQCHTFFSTFNGLIMVDSYTCTSIRQEKIQVIIIEHF